MLRRPANFLRDERASVAPTVALSIVALIATGGIAFDYARVASMDTELQNAADQAALAAASQLDGQTGACARAAAAAAGLLTNKTLFANEAGGTRPVVIPTSTVTTCAGNAYIQFYQDYNQVTDTFGAAATNDSNAEVVQVSVAPREAFYALTPIVAAIRSGNIGAQAIARLGSAICKMPPVMICNPDEVGGNLSFDPSLYVGKGLRLTSVGAGGGGWVPGNFGYLDTNITEVSGTVNQLRSALGWNTPPGECVAADGVDTKPGATVTVTDAVNTRFDIFENQNTSCWGTGTCSPAINSRKDVVRPANANGQNACGLAGNSGWQLPPNYYGSGNFPSPDTNGDGVADTYAQLQPLPTTSTPSAMGFPRDICHAVSPAGICPSGYNGRIGDGVWDRDAYFRVNYVRTTDTPGGAAGTSWSGGTGTGSWQANTGLPANATRFQVYQWELTNRGNPVDGVQVLGPHTVAGQSGPNALTNYGEPQCAAAAPSTLHDRRRIAVAVINCQAQSVNGNSDNVRVLKWIDVFLVEPSVNRERTNNGDVYAEVIGETQQSGVNQTIRREVPYLLK